MRLIDATDVVKAILTERDKIPRTITTAPYELGTEKPYHAGDQMRGGIRKALRCIEQAPTVDAVPVVRCRECKNYVIVDEFEGGKRYMCLVNHFSYLDNDGDNQFCSYGERKEGADNEP